MDTPDPTKPLKNIRHEAFCRHYAGDCWGRGNEAYRQAGFRIKNEVATCTAASRLVRNVNVAARIKHLRQQMIEEMGIDATFILKERLRIARLAESGERPDAKAALSAYSDIERSLGLNKPDKLEISGTVLDLVKSLTQQ
jgi:hypothetical protein